jgi:hypothetical protein
MKRKQPVNVFDEPTETQEGAFHETLAQHFVIDPQGDPTPTQSGERVSNQTGRGRTRAAKIVLAGVVMFTVFAFLGEAIADTVYAWGDGSSEEEDLLFGRVAMTISAIIALVGGYLLFAASETE